MNTLDCFIAYSDKETTGRIVGQLRSVDAVRSIYLLVADRSEEAVEECKTIEGCKILYVDNLYGSAVVRKVAESAGSDYALVCVNPVNLTFFRKSVDRMVSVMSDSGADMLYADRYAVKDGVASKCPTIDYQLGSVRNDFDFGSVVMYRSESLKCFAADERQEPERKYSGWYELVLSLSRKSCADGIMHLREYLYSEEERDLRKSGEKQFDYVDPRNRDVQIEMEEVCTAHLEKIDAVIRPDAVRAVAFAQDGFGVEASVVIPVRNRVRTIEDAVRSALAQKTTFEYNVLVVDNYSTDGTTDIVRSISAEDSRCVLVVPEDRNLGIGGCWGLAVSDKRCGRFAVQLDSDDLYSGEDTLQRIVDKFYEERCAMVIGSYRMCDFNLNTLPPGLIDHKEWTDENGRNNALRINGLGAPRAFYTPLLRKFGVPNTSYGEDYALGLRFSRKYRIGRIYDELYLCRRWDGNSDAALPVEKVNENNLYKDLLRTVEIKARQERNRYLGQNVGNDDARALFERQLAVWPDAAGRYRELQNVVVSDLNNDGMRLSVQYNPARILSTGASIDAASLKKRQCFLCEDNLPEQQTWLPLLGKYHLLVNPYPILPKHFTIPCVSHVPQSIAGNYADMMCIVDGLDKYMVFYNGPQCGASAPDHLHFQVGERGVVPLERDWDEVYWHKRSRLYPISAEEYVEAALLEDVADYTGMYSLRGYMCPAFVIVTRTASANVFLFRKLYDAMNTPDCDGEPMMNILSWVFRPEEKAQRRIISVIIPRAKHRPSCYYADDETKMLVSPGALDMGGLIITPREQDFKNMTVSAAAEIISEVGLSHEDKQVVLNRLKGVDVESKV